IPSGHITCGQVVPGGINTPDGDACDLTERHTHLTVRHECESSRSRQYAVFTESSRGLSKLNPTFESIIERSHVVLHTRPEGEQRRAFGDQRRAGDGVLVRLVAHGGETEEIRI